jgi:integrase
VRLTDGIIVLQAEATKTNTVRGVPISTRLKGILEMRRTGPDGKELPSDAYVFGTETGERRRNVHHGWQLAVLRAHGHEPELVRGKISPKSRAVFQQIDLHMHDLRRECGSRLLEAGAGLHEVREWLGHTDISTTGRYLAVTAESLKRALKRLEDACKVRPVRRSASPSSASIRVN